MPARVLGTPNRTIHDIARRLNVSSTTVWRAINDRPRISPQTRERVLAEVQRLGYQPSLVAQNLSWGRTQTIGVVVPTISNPVHAALVRAVEQAAFSRDYSIVLCDTDFSITREQHYLDLLVRRRVEGVLLVPYAEDASATDETHLAPLLNAGIAVVSMQQRLQGSPVSQVLPDNFAAARDMTRHLIRLGHRRIAFVHCGLAPWFVSMNERAEGYKAALREAGIAFDPRLVTEIGTFESLVSDSGGDFFPDRFTSLLNITDRPTAMFAPTDILAIKVIQVARNRGLRVPDDLAIVGFDNIQMSAYTDPPLTTVRHPATEVACKAAELLFEQLAGGSGPEQPVLERVPCELIIRRSCGAEGRPPQQNEKRSGVGNI